MRKEAHLVLHELEELFKQRYVSSFSLALVHAGLGQRDEAFAGLEDAYDQHPDTIVILKVYPWLDGLRSDPRFTELTRRVGL